MLTNRSRWEYEIPDLDLEHLYNRVNEIIDLRNPKKIVSSDKKSSAIRPANDGPLKMKKLDKKATLAQEKEKKEELSKRNRSNAES